MKPREIMGWQCSCCGRIYFEKSVAEMCCVCKECGKEGTHNGLVACIDCQSKARRKRDLKRWDEARKVNLSEYEDDTVYVESMEQYVEADHNMLWETFDESQYPDKTHLPSYRELGVYGIERRTLGIDANMVYEQVCEESYEDYSMSDEASRALYDMCSEWNERFGESMYVPDYKTAITEG